MRLFTLLLGCWLLFLSFLPCADLVAHAAGRETTITANTTHHHQHPNGDHCTPFCTCSCCATFLILQKEHELAPNHLIVESQSYPTFHVSFDAAPPLAIWQPPQLV